MATHYLIHCLIHCLIHKERSAAEAYRLGLRSGASHFPRAPTEAARQEEHRQLQLLHPLAQCRRQRPMVSPVRRQHRSTLRRHQRKNRISQTTPVLIPKRRTRHQQLY